MTALTTDPAIDKLMADINKDLKSTVLRYADTLPSFTRVTTGSLAFDLALGGGFPLNVWNEIIGLESHGKTVLAMKTLAANMLANPKFRALWIASEDYNAEWAATLGVDNTRVTIAGTNVMEDAYTIMLKGLDSQLFDAVVLDSYPALVAQAEEESTMYDATVAIGARLTNKLMRVSTPAMHREVDERSCLCLIINQWRDKIGTFMGDPRVTPGGKGKNFSFFTRVEVVRDGWLEGPSKVKVGQKIVIRTIKNKTAPPSRRATTNFYFDDCSPFHVGDYDTMAEVFNIALTYGVIERKGAWFHYNDQKWNGKEPLLLSFREDLDLQRDIDTEVRHKVLGITPPRKRSVRKKLQAA